MFHGDRHPQAHLTTKGASGKVGMSRAAHCTQAAGCGPTWDLVFQALSWKIWNSCCTHSALLRVSQHPVLCNLFSLGPHTCSLDLSHLCSDLFFFQQEALLPLPGGSASLPPPSSYHAVWLVSQDCTAS